MSKQAPRPRDALWIVELGGRATRSSCKGGGTREIDKHMAQRRAVDGVEIHVALAAKLDGRRSAARHACLIALPLTLLSEEGFVESTGGEGKDTRRRAQASRGTVVIGGGRDPTRLLSAEESKPIEGTGG